ITLPDERLARQRQTESLLAMCRSCGECLQASILTLQSCAKSAGCSAAEQRRIEQSVAGLKHVRDLLTGKLPFDPATMQQQIVDAMALANSAVSRQQAAAAVTPTSAADQETEMTPVPAQRPVFTFAADDYNITIIDLLIDD
uniref:Type VI secretion system ATPase TssH n=1 Tax=Macrostomum lignano TaxID=282301 RepID=A0A1I8FT57_9PLAT